MPENQAGTPDPQPAGKADSGTEDTSGPGAADTTSRRRRKGTTSTASPFANWLKEIATVVVIAVVLSFLIKTFLFRAFWIPSESMVSTLEQDDRIFVNLLVPEPFSMSRGDVVVFRDTKDWLPAVPQTAEEGGPLAFVREGLTFVGLLPDVSEQHLVKRVIGLPGDRVICCDAAGKLSINGATIDESYINDAEVPQVQEFDVVVPEGKVWVMGDNRNHSADSRAHRDTNGGFVDIEDIEGKAVVIAWPVDRWSVLSNYPDVYRNVPAAG